MIGRNSFQVLAQGLYAIPWIDTMSRQSNNLRFAIVLLSRGITREVRVDLDEICRDSSSACLRTGRRALALNNTIRDS
jgi:hypothetical protein